MGGGRGVEFVHERENYEELSCLFLFVFYFFDDFYNFFFLWKFYRLFKHFQGSKEVVRGTRGCGILKRGEVSPHLFFLVGGFWFSFQENVFS